jgi:hypothetical protein
MSNGLPNETLFQSFGQGSPNPTTDLSDKFGKVDDLYPTGLDIPKANKIEEKTKEIAILPIVPKHLYYNFYSMLSKKIYTLFSGNIQYQLSGKANEPNIVFSKGSQYTAYSSQKLYIFSKIHENDLNTDGELVIENLPITNSDKKIFICFPLKTITENVSKHSNLILDQLIQNTLPEQLPEINLNTILPMEDDGIYYETSTAKIVVFQTPLHVFSHFTGFTKGELHELQIKPATVERIRASSNYFSNKSLNISGHLQGPTMLENTTIQGWNTFDTKEGFIEGNDPNAEIKWMECDNVPLDYSEEIPTYQIAAGSVTKDYQTQLLSATINIIWVISIVVFLIFVLPSIYTLFVSRGIVGFTDPVVILDLIRNFEFTWVLLLVIPAFVFIITGSSLLNTCNLSLNDLSSSSDPTQKNMDLLRKCMPNITTTTTSESGKLETKTGSIWPNVFNTNDEVNDAISKIKTQINSQKNLAISGGVILGLWFLATTIMLFYKITNPDFMHLENFKFVDEYTGNRILALPFPPSGKLIAFWKNVFVGNTAKVTPI